MTNRIRELRIARNLTLEEVALNVGTSVQQLSRLERGARRLTDDWMRRIARALYVRPADLLSDGGEDNRELIERPEEVRLLRFWRLLSLDEKRMIAAVARDKGLEILNNGPRKQRA
jgi:transcriptional regulator with XRE-family HTH domain